MKIINNPNPVVIIDWNDFEKIILLLPKNQLVKIFFEKYQWKDVKKLSHERIINCIFDNYEEDMRGVI